MQPYLLPYIGYYQLIAAVDRFVVYDNIQYSKGGWINRNRLYRNGGAAYFTLPLRAGSDYLDIREREIAADYRPRALIDQLRGAYATAPQFARVLPLLQRVFGHGSRNLFDFLAASLREVCDFLGLRTPLLVSSRIPADHGLKGAARVIAICKALGATTYVNPPGGVQLYSQAEFAAHGLELRLLRPIPFEYPQPGKPFVPWLSIVDVLMCNPPDVVHETVLRRYEWL